MAICHICRHIRPISDNGLSGSLLTGAPGGDQAFVLACGRRICNRPNRRGLARCSKPSAAPGRTHSTAEWRASRSAAPRVGAERQRRWGGYVYPAAPDCLCRLAPGARRRHLARPGPWHHPTFLTEQVSDGITAIVAPVSFKLHRSKTSPLLIRYQIELVVLDDAVTPEQPSRMRWPMR